MGWLSFLSERFRPRPTAVPEHRAALAAWQALPEAALELPHARQRYVVVDVETSGLDMKRDRLIAIGAVAVQGGGIDFADAFQIVLQQREASSTENILIHGIGAGEQRAGVEPAAALLAFLDFVGKSPLVAYHAFFDEAMLAKAMRTHLGVTPSFFWLDLAWVLPELFPDFRRDGRVALDDWLAHFGIENIQRHNAVSDAYATACLLLLAHARGTARGLDHAAAFARLEKARRWLYESA